MERTEIAMRATRTLEETAGPAGRASGAEADERPGGETDETQVWSGRGRARQVSRVRRVPWVRLLLYYAAVVALALLVAQLLPIARHAFIAPVTVPSLDQAASLATGNVPRPAPEQFVGRFDRAIVTGLVIVGAFALALPIAWVAMFTRRLRYDPSLVHSIIILPVVVAGIVILVKNSLALAFSLAGIVAVVRFRNTLKDPKDAVYIFLVLGVGLAAGVQALDVGLLVSMAFNALVLGLWKYDVGGMYSAGTTAGLLTIGDASLLPLAGLRESERVRERAKDVAGDMETDGYLYVVAADAQAARRCVEISLTECAVNWRVGDPQRATGGLAGFVVAVDLREKATPVDLLGDMDDRWPEQIAAAAYLPFRHAPAEDGKS
jgi:hypothetical protein